MKQLTADEKASPRVVSETENSTFEERHQEHHEDQGQAPVPENGSVPKKLSGVAALAPALRLARDRRQRAERLAHQLADAQDLPEFVAIVKEHGRSAVSRAAAVRPDLMPVINGEFAHIALSLVDVE